MSERVIDLTLPITDKMPVYPGDAPVSVEPFHTIPEHGANTSQISMGSHAGTHLDAPWHFLPDGKKLNEISLERCIGPAVVLDFTMKGAGERIELEDLRPHARFIHEGARILLRTDWSRHFGSDSYYGDWPALTLEAARWLADRGIWLLGVETPSVDPRKHHDNHEALLGAEVVLIEGLANLSAIRGLRVLFVAMPLPLVGRDGSPVRAVAKEEDSGVPDLRELALAEAIPYKPDLVGDLPPVKGFPVSL